MHSLTHSVIHPSIISLIYPIFSFTHQSIHHQLFTSSSSPWFFLLKSSMSARVADEGSSNDGLLKVSPRTLVFCLSLLEIKKEIFKKAREKKGHELNGTHLFFLLSHIQNFTCLSHFLFIYVPFFSSFLSFSSLHCTCLFNFLFIYVPFFSSFLLFSALESTFVFFFMNLLLSNSHIKLDSVKMISNYDWCLN